MVQVVQVVHVVQVVQVVNVVQVARVARVVRVVQVVRGTGWPIPTGNRSIGFHMVMVSTTQILQNKRSAGQKLRTAIM